MSLRRLSTNGAYTNLGAFAHQITLTMPASDSLADGSPDTQTTYQSGVWASIRLMKQQEINLSELEQGASYFDVRLQYDPNITSQFTVISPTGQTWYIESIADIDGQQRELKLTCRAINDGGTTTEITEIVVGGTF